MPPCRSQVATANSATADVPNLPPGQYRVTLLIVDSASRTSGAINDFTLGSSP
jgi:hypothetical protein